MYTIAEQQTGQEAENIIAMADNEFVESMYCFLMELSECVSLTPEQIRHKKEAESCIAYFSEMSFLGKAGFAVENFLRTGEEDYDTNPRSTLLDDEIFRKYAEKSMAEMQAVRTTV